MSSRESFIWWLVFIGTENHRINQQSRLRIVRLEELWGPPLEKVRCHLAPTVEADKEGRHGKVYYHDMPIVSKRHLCIDDLPVSY